MKAEFIYQIDKTRLTKKTNKEGKEVEYPHTEMLVRFENGTELVLNPFRVNDFITSIRTLKGCVSVETIEGNEND